MKGYQHMIYFNEATGNIFVLLTNIDEKTDETELAAGQVGLQGEILE